MRVSCPEPAVGVFTAAGSGRSFDSAVPVENVAYALRTRADAACPLRARSAGQYGELTVTPGQPNRLTHLRTGRLTRCAYRPSKQEVGADPKASVPRRAPAVAASGLSSPKCYEVRTDDGGHLILAAYV